jgi:CRP-like cAMP-binding protein
MQGEVAVYSASENRPMTMTKLIRKLESIATLSDEDFRIIESLPSRTRTLKAGQDIFHEGDQPSQCCLILEGWTCRYRLLDGGRRQIFSFHIPGDLPDLQSLHLHTLDHSLGTMTDATVAFVPHENIRDLMLRFPRLGALLWRDTLIDAAIFREWMVGMGRKSAYGRIGHLFCEMYAKLEAVGLASDHRCAFPVKQIDIADSLGLTNVHVNRVLQDMRAKGLITFRNGTLVVHEWNELVRTAEFDPAYLHLKKAA